MADIMAKLRYFPLGLVSGPAVPIMERDLDDIAGKCGAIIELEKIEGKTAQVSGDMIREETIDHAIEEISQDVITVTSQDEDSFAETIRELVRKYRAPRTVFATWGSSERGKQIISRVFDENDGWA